MISQCRITPKCQSCVLYLNLMLASPIMLYYFCTHTNLWVHKVLFTQRQSLSISFTAEQLLSELQEAFGKSWAPSR